MIFCRNVMIYFDQPTREKLVNRFSEMLAPGGYLCIGHSESIHAGSRAASSSSGKTILPPQRGRQWLKTSIGEGVAGVREHPPLHQSAGPGDRQAVAAATST